MKLLGIDNVFFDVTDLEAAIRFYENLGFKLKFKIPHLAAALLSIGSEEPGLMIWQKKYKRPSTLWIEVSDAQQAQKECTKYSIAGTMLETATGFTFEIIDPWGNILGFADYSKKPELARSR
jgi:predicted enzyme related to lactoylglutathione lyase